jgi:hypothetical protein
VWWSWCWRRWDEHLYCCPYHVFNDGVLKLITSLLFKFEIVTDISIELSRLIDKDIFESKLSNIFTEEKLIKTITDCLGDYKFEKESNDYFIWIS